MSGIAATASLASAWRSVRADPSIASLAIIAVVPAGVAGGLAGAAMAIASLALTAAVARAVATVSDRAFMLRLGLGSIALHSTVAAALDIHLRSLNSVGALFYDDSAYVLFAKMLVQYWDGQIPSLPSDPSLSNTYVILVGLLFSFFGPVVLLPRLLNAALITVAALLLYRTMRNLEMPGGRLAAVLLLVYPSVALWSLVVLKDVYVLTFAVMAVWSASEFIRSRNHLWWLATIAAFLAVESTRKYVFIVIVLAWPLGLLFALPKAERLRATVLAAMTAVVLFAVFRPFDVYNTGTFAGLAQIRANMAFGARTAFVEPETTVHLAPGTEFVVGVADQTAAPECRTVIVEPGAKLFVASSLPPEPPDPARVIVRPCDRIVVRASRPGRSPTVTVTTGAPPTGAPPTGAPPTGAPPPVAVVQTVQLRPDVPNVIGTPPPRAVDDSVALQRGIADSITHLPVGVLHLIGAPFPLGVRTVEELATVPEMLIWYASLVLAVLGLIVLGRARDLRFAYGVIVLGGFALILSLAEGNVGTLMRHRAMLIPFVIVLAMVGLDRVRAYRTARLAR